jgi:hypothetical protein
MLDQMTHFKYLARRPLPVFSRFSAVSSIHIYRKMFLVAALFSFGSAWSPAEVVPPPREASKLPFLWGAQHYRATTPDA